MESDEINISVVDLTCCNLKFKTEIVFKMHRAQIHGDIFQKPKWMLLNDTKSVAGETVQDENVTSNSKQNQLENQTDLVLNCPYCGLQTAAVSMSGHIKENTLVP